jgi:hypothetical protein
MIEGLLLALDVLAMLVLMGWSIARERSSARSKGPHQVHRRQQ